MFIQRHIKSSIFNDLQDTPAVALLGPRQIGKTTLARQVQKEIGANSVFLDMEDEEDYEKLNQPSLYLNQHANKLIIIDEIQRRPKLFPPLKAIIDKDRRPGRFLLLGSASPELLARSSETLADRISFIYIHPFHWQELSGHYPIERLWMRGGFPDFFLIEGDERSLIKRKALIRTYMDRELQLLGLRVMPTTLRNLYSMVAHLHGQILNYSSLSKSLGLSVSSVRRYLQYFEDAFLIRLIQPYFLNIKKRLVKAPKIYVSDSGLLHALLGITDLESISGHPSKGNSWEGFVIQQILACLSPLVDSYFYRTHEGSEIDLLLVKGIQPVIGIEIKYSNAPKLSRGTTIASQDLGDIPILVVTPSAVEDYQSNDRTTVTSFKRVFEHLERRGLLRN